MQGLALRGFHTGGRCFGYKSVKSDDGNARLEVNPSEARVVERIYRLYGEHRYSIKRIAHALNSKGVLAPQPQKGRFSRSWCVSSVRHILLNRELREITGKLLEPRPGSLRGTLNELRKFAIARLSNLRNLISHPESVHQARAVMAEQFGKLTLTPVRESGALSYAAQGKVDFFGEQAMTRVGGAGGPDCATRVYAFNLSLAA